MSTLVRLNAVALAPKITPKGGAKSAPYKAATELPAYGSITHQGICFKKMRIVRPIHVLFAGQAFFALAASIRPFVIQEQAIPTVGSGFCTIGGTPPEVHLDNATFTGICIGRAARFLGIPYAQPP